MKIGILQTGHAPESLISDTGDYDTFFHRLLDGHGFVFETFSVVDMNFPKGPDAADAWVITGSRHGAYEVLPFIPPLEDLIRAIYAEGRPMIGVCFGHQIVAQALGGVVEKFAEGWSVGATHYDYKGKTVTLNAWHQDQVIVVPREAKVIASSPFCANAALVYGDKIWTIQPHPEFDADFIDGLVRTRGKGVVPDNLLSEARARLGTATDEALIADEMASFLKAGATT